MKIGVLLLCICLTVGCIHKGSPITPWERATTDNALFAQIDNTVEGGAEAVASSGVLSNEAVAPVIAWTGQVAQAHEQVTAILAKGSSLSASDYTTIQALLAQIQASGTALVNSGAFGIKNPKSQQTISADITALVNLGNALLADLTALNVPPAIGGAN